MGKSLLWHITLALVEQMIIIQWNLPYPGTSIVQTAQIVACSLVTIMEFGLDESTRREPKGCVYLFGGLFILLVITTTWSLGDITFLQPRGVTLSAY